MKNTDFKNIGIKKNTFKRLMKILIVLGNNKCPMTTGEITAITKIRLPDVYNTFCANATKVFFKRAGQKGLFKKYEISEQGIALLKGENFDFDLELQSRRLFFLNTEPRCSEICC